MILLKTLKHFLFCLILPVLILLHTNPVCAQNTDTLTHTPKVALVLSGGGAKGFAHIGVLKILEQEGIPVDIIVGTSMGGIVGGIYSLGYTASEIENLVKKQDWKKVLSDDVPRICLSPNDQILKQRYQLSVPFSERKSIGLPGGLIRGQNILNLFCGITANAPVNADFTKFPIPFACVAVDLETGKEVIINEGFLPIAMFSSMAIPGVFQPSERDGLLLVDGGFANNFPTDVAKKMGADIIIGVDIQGDSRDQTKLKSMDEIFGQLIGLIGKEKDSINHTLCDIVIRPDITGYSVASFSAGAADTLILRGEDATKKKLEQLRAMKNNYNLEAKVKPRDLIAPDKWIITDLKFIGDNKHTEAFLKKALNLKLPGRYAYDEIKVAIDRLYGYGGFDKIYFFLTDNLDGKTLNLNIVSKKVSSANIGFKVNTIDAAAVLLNATIKNYSNTFGLLSASAELSANPGVDLVAETNNRSFPVGGVEIRGKYQKYNIFVDGHKNMTENMLYSSGGLYIYRSFRRQYKLGLKIQEEYFNGDIFSKHVDVSDSSNSINHFLTNACAYFSRDNMDNFYFPTKGTNLYIELSMTSGVEKFTDLSPILLFKMKKVIPLKPRTALLFDLYGRAISNPNFPVTKATMVGGDVFSQYFNYHIPFLGLPPVSLGDRFVYIGSLGLRVQLFKMHYISFIINAMQQGNKVLDLRQADAVYGGGIRYSIKTVVGPVDVGLGYSNSNNNTPTISANFGYWF